MMVRKPPMLPGSIKNISRELKLFALATLAMGIGYSMVEATMNNFLHEKFALSGLHRSCLEFPREIPGLVLYLPEFTWLSG